MSPETVNTSGVVGQATSFDLTLTGGSPYTYTQTFGDICDVSINNDTATVTITPVTSGTLTGSITFDNQATCNITIDVTQPHSPVTVTPTTVSENGVVGQSTSFNLTLTGATTYTYTQTFGNICSVSINENIATVTITPTTSGTLTGSITFNNEATCNITINVSQPTPTEGLQPSTVTYTMNAQESKNFDFTLHGYDSDTEGVYYECFIDDSLSPLNSSISSLSGQPLTNPDGYRVTIESNNQREQASVGIVYAVATIYDKPSEETLRTYTATINLTIEPV